MILDIGMNKKNLARVHIYVTDLLLKNIIFDYR